jgi:hypothetical protein
MLSTSHLTRKLPRLIFFRKQLNSSVRECLTAIMQLSLLMEQQALGKHIRKSWLFHNINRMLGTEDKPGIMF